MYYFSEVMVLIIDESNEYEAWWNDNDWGKTETSTETPVSAILFTTNLTQTGMG